MTLASRFATIVSGLTTEDSVLDRFCRAGQMLLEADGAAITVNYDRSDRHTVSSTSALALMIEDAQHVVGEGPGFDASRSQEVVSGIFGRTAETPWPRLEHSVAGLGFSGPILAVPIVTVGRPLGVLVVHRESTPLTFEPDTARFLATTLGAALVEHSTPAILEEELTQDWSSRAIVHQATGMVTTQLQIDPDDALTLLRAHAYALDSSLLDVAFQVVDRALTFDEFSKDGR